MRNILGVLLFILTLSGCSKFTWDEINYHLYERDARKNILNEKDDTIFTIYIGMYDDKTEETFKGYYEGRKKFGLSYEHYLPKETIAFRQCYKNFGNIREKVVFKEIIKVTEMQKETYRLGFDRYAKYTCEKTDMQLAYEKQQKEKKIEKTNKTKKKSNNTRSRIFTCSLKNAPSEKAKIFIEGPSAYETTAIGIKITYSNVEYTDKGAFILTDSSKDVRSWFIGAISLLQVGNYKYYYDCK